MGRTRTRIPNFSRRIVVILFFSFSSGERQKSKTKQKRSSPASPVSSAQYLQYPGTRRVEISRTPGHKSLGLQAVWSTVGTGSQRAQLGSSLRLRKAVDSPSRRPTLVTVVAQA